MLGLGGVGVYSQSPESELSGYIAGRLNVLLSDSDDESDFSSECLIREEKLDEIMQELYREITSPSCYNTSPPTVPLTSPSSSSSPPFSSLPFFAVSDVQSESCGASMSNSSSTVMAGIEFMGQAGNFSDVKAGLPEAGNIDVAFDNHHNHNHSNSNHTNMVGGACVEGLGEEKKMEGCDEGEVGDDQWLARVLGWGPLELDEWT